MPAARVGLARIQLDPSRAWYSVETAKKKLNAAVFGEALRALSRWDDASSQPGCDDQADGATLPSVKRKRRNRVMEYFAGLDVSVDETAICVVGDDGQVVLKQRLKPIP